MTTPGTMYITDAFFEEPVRNIIQRCVEHGIWNALWSISVHLQRIDENRRNFTQLSDFGPLINETKYEFWIFNNWIGNGYNCILDRVMRG